MRKEKRWNYERTTEKEFRYNGTVREVTREAEKNRVRRRVHLTEGGVACKPFSYRFSVVRHEHFILLYARASPVVRQNVQVPINVASERNNLLLTTFDLCPEKGPNLMSYLIDCTDSAWFRFYYSGVLRRSVKGGRRI